jgi:hypothetical protein
VIATTDAEQVLHVLGAAFPTYPAEQPSTDLYLSALALPPFYDLSTLLAATTGWVLNHDRFPTVHQLVDAYQAEARRRVLARQQAEQARAEAAGTLPGMAPPLAATLALEMVDVLRTALTESVAGGAPHTGHDKYGAGTCTTCLARPDVEDAIEARVFQLLQERGLHPAGQPVATHACGRCLDTGFQVIDHDIDTMAPCSDCNREGYERWRDGHLAPGHWCTDCDNLTRGRK